MNHPEEVAHITPDEPEPSPPRLPYQPPRLESHGAWNYVIGVSLPIGGLPALEKIGSEENG